MSKLIFKKIYRKLVSNSYIVIQKIDACKTWAFEWIEIFRKQKMYSDIKWTKDQKNQFQEYWGTYYGKKVSTRWHKLYQKTNGNFSVEYFPEILFSTKLEPMVNKLTICKVLQDKALTELLYGQHVKVPKTFIVNSSGIYYDQTRNVISPECAFETLSDIGPVIIKPTIGGSSGEGVKKVDLVNGGDDLTGISLSDLIKKYKSDFIIQEIIQPNSKYSSLHPSSINTIRIITYILNGRLYHAPITMRIGTGFSNVDNIHSGGLVIHVSDRGELDKYAYKLGYGDSGIKYSKHPDTGIVFAGYQLTGIQEVIEKSYILHGHTPHAGIVSWDFTVDSGNEVVLIESNLYGQSAWFPQMCSGKSLFGDNTTSVLKLLKGM